MLEKDLKEIIIVKTDTKEVLAVIPNEPQKKEIIQCRRKLFSEQPDLS